MLRDRLLRLRLNPLALIVESWRVARAHWRALLVITLLTWLPLAAADTVVRPVLVQRMLRSYGLWEWAWTAYSVVGPALSSWLAGIRWMAIALVVRAGVVEGVSVGAGQALRRSFSTGWAWVLLWLILFIPGTAKVLADLLGAFVESRRLGPIAYHHVEHLRLHGVLVGLFGQLIDLPFLYITFAPLALILDGVVGVKALRTNWRRVRGNWLWLCGGVLTLWLLSVALTSVLWLLHATAWVTGAGFVLHGLLTPFLRVAKSLQYINLMQLDAEQGDRVGFQAALSANVDETPTPWKYSVEGETGNEDVHGHGRGAGGAGDRGAGEGATAAVHGR